MVNLINELIMKNISIFLLLLLVACSKGEANDPSSNEEGNEEGNEPQQTLLESRTAGQVILSPSAAQIAAQTTRGELIETINYDYEILRYTFEYDDNATYRFAVLSGDTGYLIPFENGSYTSKLSFAEDSGSSWLVAEELLTDQQERLASGSRLFCFAMNGATNSALTSSGASSVTLATSMPNTFDNSEISPLEGADFADNLYLQGVYEVEQATTLSQLTESSIELTATAALIGVRITNNCVIGASHTISSASISTTNATFPSSATLDGKSITPSTSDLYSEISATTTGEGVTIAPGEHTTLYMYALPNSKSALSSDITISAVIDGENQELYRLTPATLAAMNSQGESYFEGGEAYIFDTNIVDSSQIALSMSDEDIATAIFSGTKFTFDIEAVNVAWESTMPDWLSISPSWCSDPMYDAVTVTVTITKPDTGATSGSGELEFIDLDSGEVIHSISIVQPMTTIATNLMNLLSELNSGDDTPVTLNWDTATPLEDWEGVTLDEDGNVVGLALSNKGFEGVIPSTYISKFTELVTLDLSHNSLSDAMLIAYGNLKSLEYLDVSHNQITKVNMQAFKSDETNTRSMKYLYLNDNVIESSTGGVNEIINIPTLVEFSFANNLMSTSISEYSGTEGPANLELFDISGNEFKGTIPWYLSNSPHLKTLKTAGNTSLGGVLTDALINQLGYSEAQVEEYITNDTSITRE